MRRATDGAFDVTRLAVGRRYEFTLADDPQTCGVLRAKETPTERGDGGRRPWVSDGAQDHYNDRDQVVTVKRSRGGGVMPGPQPITQSGSCRPDNMRT